MELLCNKVVCLGIQGIPKSINAAIKKTCCAEKTIPYGGFQVHDIPCILRSCKQCGLEQLKQEICEKNSKEFMERQCSWNMWTQDKSNDSTKLVNKEMLGSYLDLVNTYLEQLHYMAWHMFNAKWQFNDLRMLKSNLGPGEILMVHDFAQNYICISQDEAQGGHYLHKQVTIHPTISYRVCPSENCNKTVCEEIIHISNDSSHDQFAVAHFRKGCIELMKSLGESVERIFEYTDQAPNQYKNRNAFQRLSKVDYPCVSNFYGVQHGESVADGAAGRVKRTAWVGVLTKKATITNAKQFYDYCKENMETTCDATVSCCHYRVTFKYAHGIKRTSTNTSVTIDRTRDIHSVRNIGHNGLIQYRYVSCSCHLA